MQEAIIEKDGNLYKVYGIMDRATNPQTCRDEDNFTVKHAYLYDEASEIESDIPVGSLAVESLMRVFERYYQEEIIEQIKEG